MLLDLGVTWLQRSPYAMRTLFGVLRRTRPSVLLGRTLVLTRAEDVREVLARPEDFEIAPQNFRKMLCGPFVLGLDLSPRYLREQPILRGELDASVADFAEVARSAADEVARAALPELSRARRARRFDAVGCFAEIVTTRVASRFFGVPADGASSAVLAVTTGEDVLRLWLRKLGSIIADQSPAPFGLQQVGEACAPEFVAHVSRVLADVQHKSTDEDTGLLGRFVVLQRSRPDRISDDWIVRNVIGLMLAGSAAITKGFAHALDELLRRPAEFRIACELANSEDSDVELLAMIREALRFNPVFPLLSRFCPRPTSLSVGTSRELEVPAGTRVIAPPLGAMFDPDAVEEPDTFGPSRDPDTTYLHFGYGQHACLGRRHAEAELLELFRAFLRLPGACALEPGRLGYDGPAVDRYLLHWPAESQREIE